MKGKFAAAIALLACFGAGQAQAVMLNPKGLGQVLIYPYYTVNKGQDTLVSVVNASERGKVIKVRFLEGYNSRTVLDFNLFLSPGDAWTGAVTADAGSGGARLLTYDTSCTWPLLPATGMPFQKANYAGGAAPPYHKPDGGPTDLARTREGSIELIAMGDIVPGSATAGRITHALGKPPGCAELSSVDPTDLTVPGDDLLGSGAIVNVGEGTFYSYNADALSGFTDIAFARPEPFRPSLDQANSSEVSTGGVRAHVVLNGRPMAIDYAKARDAVSAVFMADTLINEYVNTLSLGAATDWIVTFPTKRFYTDPALNPDDQAYLPLPFHDWYGQGQANVLVTARFFDREAWFVKSFYESGECGYPCPGIPPLVIPYSVNVLRILPQHPRERPSEVFGSMLSSALVPAQASVQEDYMPPRLPGAGWVHLDLAHGGQPHELWVGKSADGGAPVILYGLPATGFMAYNVINANAQPGKLANYGGAFPHRSTVRCFPNADHLPGPCP